MKLPSIQQVFQESARTFQRFPIVLIDAALGTLAALILVDHEPPAQATMWFNLLFASILGLPLLLALALGAEKRRWGKTKTFALQGLGVVLLVIYAFTVPTHLMNAPAIHLLRLLILVVGLIFFLAIFPFAWPGEVNGFWQYNKTLVFRLLTCAGFAAVLYVGFAIALAALDQLFGMDIPGKRYAELWILIAGIFSTWFFLAGIPDDLNGLERSGDYPKGLKIFAQYILSSVVLVYLVILYAYVAKILITWTWPQGWVSKLILSFSALGLFSLLLLYPIRDLPGNNWIKIAWRWFFYILIPLVIMLPFAVWRRVSQYGITEGRYLAFALAAWLAAMILYYVFSKKKSIKVIPGSLAVLAGLACFGPWSVFGVSAESQINRLYDLLVKNSILVDGKIHKAAASISDEDAKQISSVLSYLHDFHGYDRIQSWFQVSVQEDSADKASAFKKPADLAAIMGISYMRGWMEAGAKTINLIAAPSGVYDIAGYERMLRTFYVNEGGTKKDYPEERISYQISKNLDSILVVARYEDQATDSVQITLQPLLDVLVKEYGNTNPHDIPLEKMAICKAGKRLKVKVYLLQTRLQRTADHLKPTSYRAEIFYTLATNDRME